MNFLRYLCLILLCFTNISFSGGTLDSLPKGKSPWGDILNPDETIPDLGFMAFYINTNDPKKVITSEAVKYISMDYAFDQFNKIPSKDFGAYWVGKLIIPKTGVYQATVNQSHAKTRIMINRHVIYSGDNRGKERVLLDKGEYRLEVEHINNWHTTDVTVNINPSIESFKRNEIKEKIAEMNLPASTVVYNISADESKNRYNSIFVKVTNETRPYILILNSRENVLWEVTKDTPALVIYNLSERGSRVTTRENVPVLALDGNLNFRVDNYTFDKCECNEKGRPNCPSVADLNYLSKRVKTLTGFPLVGVNSEQKENFIEVPKVEINDEVLAKNQKAHAQRKAVEASCHKPEHKTQTTDNLMGQ